MRRTAHSAASISLSIAVALSLATVGAGPAFAAQRYVAPTPVGTKDCSSSANACSIEQGVEKAVSGDEVIVEPGSYGTASAPLASSILDAAPNVKVHGVDSTPGPPGARIFTEAVYGIQIDGTGSTIRDLEVQSSAASSGAALLLEGEGVVGTRMVVRGGEHTSTACALEITATLSDSVCQKSGFGAAVRSSGTLDGPDTVTLRNVTATSASGEGIVAESAAPAGRSVSINVINTIARGGRYDLFAFESGQPASISASHSNYTTKHSEGGAAVGGDGTNQTVGDQTLAELFVEAAGGDFREAEGAQTIAAGVDAESNGPLDLNGNPREFASHTDIGAYECISPTVATGAAASVGETTATLTGSVNPNALPTDFQFAYGPTAAYGSATAVASAGASGSAVGVSTTLTGLAPDTTYHYELLASACGGTGSGGDGTFTTAPVPSTASPPPPPPPSPIAPPPPSVTDVSQSAKSWREGSKLTRASSVRGVPRGKHKAHKPPVGTTFSFTLNESATVTLSFTHGVPGRKATVNGERRCLAPSKHDRPEHKCTRIVVAGTLPLTAHQGRNKVSFEGRFSRRRKLAPGRYELVIAASNSAGHSASKSLSFTVVK
jgi:hypothetical protein